MIKKTVITNKTTGDYTIAFAEGNVENVNPIEYIKSYELYKRVSSKQEFYTRRFPSIDPIVLEEKLKKILAVEVKELFSQIEKEKIHPNFLNLLSTIKKKEQVRLLKGLTLTPFQLTSLIFKSYSEFGYRYSKYRFENIPPQFTGKKIPHLFTVNDDGTVKKIGSTDLTEGSMRQLIEQRTVVVAHFFEKENVWHCFFSTYDSAAGQENYKGGQAHMHYISSGFGVTKGDFIASLESGNYRSTSVHIDLLEYGKQAGLNKQ